MDTGCTVGQHRFALIKNLIERIVLIGGEHTTLIATPIIATNICGVCSFHFLNAMNSYKISFQIMRGVLITTQLKIKGNEIDIRPFFCYICNTPLKVINSIVVANIILKLYRYCDNTNQFYQLHIQYSTTAMHKVDESNLSIV